MTIGIEVVPLKVGLCVVVLGYGGLVIVPEVDVLPGGPVRDEEMVEEHPSPWAVTVTVTVPTLTVDTTVVVDHEVTVDAGHCESVVDRVLEVTVSLVLVDVEEPDLGVEEELGPSEEVGRPVVDDDEVLAGGTPHSSKLWPSSQHHTLPPNSRQAQ